MTESVDVAGVELAALRQAHRIIDCGMTSYIDGRQHHYRVVCACGWWGQSDSPYPWSALEVAMGLYMEHLPRLS